jgi:hypothetical protein
MNANSCQTSEGENEKATAVDDEELCLIVARNDAVARTGEALSKRNPTPHVIHHIRHRCRLPKATLARQPQHLERQLETSF